MREVKRTGKESAPSGGRVVRKVFVGPANRGTPISYVSTDKSGRRSWRGYSVRMRSPQDRDKECTHGAPAILEVALVGGRGFGRVVRDARRHRLSLSRPQERARLL